MKKFGTKQSLVTTIVMVLLLAITMPATSFGKDRGRRHGRGGNWDKKCSKFVNCHDARDGRWDGRGPRRNARNWRDSRWWDSDGRWRNRRTSERRWWNTGSRDNRWRNRNVDDRWRDTTRRRSHDNRWRDN